MTDTDKTYLGILQDILDNGIEKETRAGRAKSVFGRQARFNLKKGVPLLTTKKVFTKGVIHELLWFLSGSTNIKYLVDNNVHIWDDDAYRYYRELFLVGGKEKYCMSKEEFLEAVKEGRTYAFKTNREGFLKYYKAGDLGDIYGKQWRRFGKKEVDQINNIIETLKADPSNRRMLCVAFNPDVMDDVALPPCHVMFQFYTRQLTESEIEKYKGLTSEPPKYGLSCMFTMRSNDFMCGAPFNWLQYSILTYIIANVVNMVPDELVYSVGDCHIYLNHMEGIKEQMSREGSDIYPQLIIKGQHFSIDDFKYEDFEIVDYYPNPPIKFQLNVG